MFIIAFFTKPNLFTEYERNNNPCLQIGISCPDVDGSNSIYGALPDCTKFCQCSNGIPYLHNCPVGLHFNPSINVCDWPENAGCFKETTTAIIGSTTIHNKTTLPESTTSTLEDTTTVPNDACLQNGVVCPNVDGPHSVYAAIPDCSKFCLCSNGSPHLHDCAKGLHFNPILNVCDWPERAGCNDENNISTIPEESTNKPPHESNICLKNNVVCPTFDGSSPVFGAVPDCSKFCLCSNGIPYEYDCAANLHFNPVLNVCDWPNKAGCTNKNDTTTTLQPSTEITLTEESSTIRTTHGPNDLEICTQDNIACPEVDGPNSIYGALPDCTKFCQCSNGVPYLHTCPVGLHFNPTNNVCDWPENVGCSEGKTTSTVDSTTVQNKTETYEDTTTVPNNSTQACLENSVVCPNVDGPHSIYAPIPDCSKFCLCSNGLPYLHDCPQGLHFNPIINVCDWPERAQCEDTNNNSSTESTNSEESTIQPPSGSNICLKNNVVCPTFDGSSPVYSAVADCTKFCLCSNGIPYEYDCAADLHFNPVLNVCDWPDKAGCTSSNETTTTTQISTEITTSEGQSTASTTQLPDDSEICIQSNIVCPVVHDPNAIYGALPDCTKFCQCSNGRPYLHTCPIGLHFNPLINICDWPENSGCTEGTSTSAVDSTTTGTEDTTYPHNNVTNTCLKNGVVCPDVDGSHSVYAPIPDCSKFCLCSNGLPYLHDCSHGLHFNPILNVCDWPERAGCMDENSNSTTEPTNNEGSTFYPPHGSEMCLENNVACPSVDGYYPVYAAVPDCTKFCLCSNGIPYEYDCAADLHFNPVLNICDWPDKAGCTNRNYTTTTSQGLTEITTDVNSTSSTTQVPDDLEMCIQNNIVCPDVDGPYSVYAPIPNCSQFCLCSNGLPYLHNCSEGLHFNPILNVCDWPERAGCGDANNNTGPTNPEENTTYPPDGSEICLLNNVVCPPIDEFNPVYGAVVDCTQFCLCSNGLPYLYNCADGLHFNPVLNICDWPDRAGCYNENNTRTTTEDTQELTTDNIFTEQPVLSDICLQSNILCPEVDDEKPIYGALEDCTKFCQCSNGLPYLYNCPAGLHFNQLLNICDWPENVNCTGGDSTTAITTAGIEIIEDISTQTSSTQSPNETEICQQYNIVCSYVYGPESVYYALPNCSQFCHCFNGVPILRRCPSGLQFNPILHVCDWPSNSHCGDVTTTEITTEKTTTTPAWPQNDTETCLKNNISCSSTDHPHSVFGALPDCNQFCECSNGTAYLHECPEGLHFNSVLNLCDRPESAGCSDVNNNNPEEDATTQTSSNPQQNGSEICVQNNIDCPVVDGPESVYGALPDCTKFCQCSNGAPYVYDCPLGLHFNPKLNICEWPEDAGCLAAK